jgi:epoxide hydrolase-like predicted phosphatase
MIKAIAFDYGGVIELNEGDLIQKIVKSLQIGKEDWHKVYYSLNYLCNTGKKSWEEVALLTAQKLNASDAQISNMQEIIKASKDTKKLNLELIEIIKDLKNKEYKIGLLSNNSLDLRKKLFDQKILNLFDAVIISAEVGYQKPQPEIFEILFKTLGVKKNEMIFIDDSERSLEGADDLGYLPILYKDNKQLLEDLSKRRV